MRIVAGELKGRQFDSPHGHRTHPMSDKARGALFSALGDIVGLTVLDAFAGSGALAIEAISQGASRATAIDIDKKAVATIDANLQKLQLQEQIKVIRANASGWSDNNSDKQFDLVFCDPPYDQLQLKLLQKLARHASPDGLYILSWPGNLEVPAFQGLEHLKTKSYGDNQLAFYRRIS